MTLKNQMCILLNFCYFSIIPTIYHILQFKLCTFHRCTVKGSLNNRCSENVAEVVCLLMSSESKLSVSLLQII